MRRAGHNPVSCRQTLIGGLFGRRPSVSPIILAVPAVLLIFAGESLAQEGYRISDVRIEGSNIISEGTLREHLLFPPSSWLGITIFGSDPSFFTDETIDREAESLRRFLQTEGFLRSTVSGSVAGVEPDGQTVGITYVVREGSPVLVGNVTIHVDDTVGNESADSLLLMLNNAVGMKPGERFRDEDVTTDRKSLLAALNNSGFPYATAVYSLALGPEEETVDVDWGIHTGVLSYFGEFSIEGNDLYNEELITDRISFSKGEMYRQSLLEKTQRDIYDLGLYRVVSLRARLNEENPSVVPILISVQEASRYRLQLGVGYGRDELFRVSGKLDIYGVFGTAGQVGIEVRRSALEPFTFLVTYLHPDFIIPKTRFLAKPFLRQEDEPGYEAKRRGYDISLTRPLWVDLFASLMYSSEQVDMLRTPAVTLPETYADSYPKEGMTLTIGYNSASPLFSPATGFSVALSSMVSGLDWLRTSTYDFNRFLFDGRWYTSPAPWLVVATRLKVGTLNSKNVPAFIPFEERFYAGGSLSVRGWARSTLGPLDGNGNPTGGNSLLETGIEFRFPKGDSFSGVLFLDAGNVWEESFTYRLDDLGVAGGGGLRYETPIGPIRVDVAHPIGRGSQRVQWWFSIGHAF